MFRVQQFARCAAIDIGSGMMKFLAYGDSGRIARTVSVPFAHALATSATPNELPPHVLGGDYGFIVDYPEHGVKD